MLFLIFYLINHFFLHMPTHTFYLSCKLCCFLFFCHCSLFSYIIIYSTIIIKTFTKSQRYFLEEKSTFCYNESNISKNIHGPRADGTQRRVKQGVCKTEKAPAGSARSSIREGGDTARKRSRGGRGLSAGAFCFHYRVSTKSRTFSSSLQRGSPMVLERAWFKTS